MANIRTREEIEALQAEREATIAKEFPAMNEIEKEWSRREQHMSRLREDFVKLIPDDFRVEVWSKACAPSLLDEKEIYGRFKVWLPKFIPEYADEIVLLDIESGQNKAGISYDKLAQNLAQRLMTGLAKLAVGKYYPPPRSTE